MSHRGSGSGRAPGGRKVVLVSARKGLEERANEEWSKAHRENNCPHPAVRRHNMKHVGKARHVDRRHHEPGAKRERAPYPWIARDFIAEEI